MWVCVRVIGVVEFANEDEAFEADKKALQQQQSQGQPAAKKKTAADDDDSRRTRSLSVPRTRPSDF
jgi:hypothetical protein